MAGGASSRMKRSLDKVNLESKVLETAKKVHKSLIPLDDAGNPLLYYLLKNIAEAGITNVYLITSKDNQPFYDFLNAAKNTSAFAELSINIAVQHIPENREKPLGTADALQQCLQQYPELLAQRFTVCNGDNLYSVNSLVLLKNEREGGACYLSLFG